jgi:hypothetical protein
VVKDDLLDLLLHLVGLAKDHVALALDRRLLELGVLQDVGEDVDAAGDVRVERFGVVDRVLALWGGEVVRASRETGTGGLGDIPRCRR